MLEENKHPIIIFDGLCNFCNGSVNFIIKRDAPAYFCFTPMQSDLARSLMKRHGLDRLDADTFVLIKEDKSYIRTEAVLEVCRDLQGYWYLFRVMRVIPVGLRDYFYKFFAKNRYRLFGKKETCVVPTDDTRHRFLDV